MRNVDRLFISGLGDVEALRVRRSIEFIADLVEGVRPL